MLCFAEIDHKRHGWQAEQAEQVDADRQTCDIGNEYHPAVAFATVGLLTPFQDSIEHQGRQKTRKGIYLCLHGGEPERVTESIGQSPYKAAGLNADCFHNGEMTVCGANQLSGEVGNGEKQEEDAPGTQQGR